MRIKTIITRFNTEKYADYATNSLILKIAFAYCFYIPIIHIDSLNGY